MVRAIWHGEVIAHSDTTRRVEGNHYFPPESVRQDLLVPSPSRTWCYWKGRAQYYSIVVDDEVNVDAAWSYPKPWPLARWLKDHVAFSAGVRIER